MERKNQKTKSVGNGEGSLYYSEKLKCWIFQYVYNGKRKTLKQKKNETVKDFKARVTKLKNDINIGSFINKICAYFHFCVISMSIANLYTIINSWIHLILMSN